MPNMPKSVASALRIIVAAACCWGIWSSLNFARADYLFQKDNDQSIRSAIHLVPDGWPYYMRLAQFDRTNARHLLESSLQLNPYNAQVDIELGLQYEAAGDLSNAERHLLNAYSIDRTYLPRWSLANFYFRHDNMPAFWTWARSAAAMPADDIGALLELCWRAAPDPQIITDEILNEKPEFLRQYINFLISASQPRALASVAPHLVKAGDAKSDLPVLLSVVNRLIVAGDPTDSVTLWHLLAERNWVIADSTVPNNASFRRTPSQSSFDWSVPEYPGLHSWFGPSGLVTEFSGSEPEDCVITEQAVVLKPGNYTMAFRYHTSTVPPNTGIKWQIIEPKSQKLIAESSDLSSDQIKTSQVNFALPETSPLILRLNYHRSLGTVRISGMLDIETTEVQVQQN
jgi:hypothetical protein